MKKRRLALLLVAVLIALYFVVGGGWGAKANSARLNKMERAYFAHRAGDVHGVPENTLEGVAHSLALGFAGVEIDIHATRDSVFVLFHDDSCQRLLGMEGTVDRYTYAELAARPLLSHTIPTTSRAARLDTVLARYGDSLLFYLDIKVTGGDQAEAIADLVERYAPAANVLIASSSIPFITSLEFNHPELNTVLEGFDQGEEWTWWLFPKNFRPDFVSSFAIETDSAHVNWLREHGLLANKIVYGVDSAEHARLSRLGITRFIVDEHPNSKP